MTDNVPAVVHKTALEMPIAEMEGEMVRLFIGKVPALNLQMEYGYARGAHLKLELDLRCRKYSVDEMPSGANKGELYREHVFEIVEANIVGVYTQEEIDAADGAGVGGSLAAGAEQDDDQDSDTRPNPGRSEDATGTGEVSRGPLAVGFPDF